MSALTVAGKAVWRIPVLLSPIENLRASVEAVRCLWRNRSLAAEMIRRDLVGQYAGQILGTVWVVVHPLLLFAIYITVFGAILKVRISQSATMPADYTTYVLTGLSTWLALQQGMARGTAALMGQSNLVKQVVFPVEVLPFTMAAVSMIPQLIGTVLIIGYRLATTGTLPAMYLLLPVILVMTLVLLTGIAFLFSVGTPFIRDLKDVVAVFTVVGVYVVPAFYLPQWIPHMLRPLIYANPFSYVIWVFQDVLYYGRFEHPYAWGIFFIGSVLTFAFGYRAFRSLKPYVANVL